MNQLELNPVIQRGSVMTRTAPRLLSSAERIRRVQRFFTYLILVVGAIAFLLPFLWMLSTSLKTSQDVLQFPPSFLPSQFKWRNYPDGWRALPFTRYFLNSVLVTSLAMAGSLISSTISAYAFARLKSRHSAKLFVLVLATMMIPNEVTIVPQFIMFSKLKMVNTYWPLVLPSWFGAAFYIFLLRQFFMTIPTELDDAARIDGASDLRILWSILLPLSKPGLAAVAIFAFVSNWNNYIGPLIYLRSLNKYTMALGLQLFNGQNITVYNQAMAVSIISLIPIIAVFLIAQRQFVQGITVSGIAGR